MSKIISDINKRLSFGKEKYGHGVSIKDDMSNYTRSNKDSFIDMQLEEILDGIIYTISSYLRWINTTYKLNLDHKNDNNDDILFILNKGIQYNDNVSLMYKVLLENMYNVYKKTSFLESEIYKNKLSTKM